MYCTYCGKQLEEGERCTCEEALAEQPQGAVEAVALEADPQPAEPAPDDPPQPEQNGQFSGQEVQQKLKNVSDNLMKDSQGLLEAVKQTFKAPEEALRGMAARPLAVGLEMIGIKALVLALVVLFMILRLDSLTGGWLQLPKAKPFFLILLFTFAFDYLLAWGLTLGASLLKAQTDSKTMVGVVGVSCLVQAAGILLGGLLGFISYWFSFVFLCFALLAGLLLIYRGFMLEVELDENRRIYAVSALLVIYSLLYYVLIRNVIADILVAVMSLGGLF